VITFAWTTDQLLKNVIDCGQPQFRVFALWGALGLFLLALPYHYFAYRCFMALYYPSDIPGILFFTLGFYSVLTRRMGLLYLVLVLGTLNRETIIYVSLFYLLVGCRKGETRNVIYHVILQVCLWLFLKGILYSLYRYNINPAYTETFGFYKLSIKWNFLSLGHHHLYTFLPSIFGFLWIPLLFLARHLRPLTFRRGLYLIPIFFLTIIIPGEIYELRIYAEMLPLVVWGVVFGTVGFLTRQPDSRDSNSEIWPLPEEPLR
jgi:hypothetical protein